MLDVINTSATSDDVLQSVRYNMSTHHTQLERITLRHGTRLTIMLAESIILSNAELVSCYIIIYLPYQTLNKYNKLLIPTRPWPKVSLKNYPDPH